MSKYTCTGKVSDICPNCKNCKGITKESNGVHVYLTEVECEDPYDGIVKTLDADSNVCCSMFELKSDKICLLQHELEIDKLRMKIHQLEKEKADHLKGIERLKNKNDSIQTIEELKNENTSLKTINKGLAEDRKKLINYIRSLKIASENYLKEFTYEED